MSNLSSFIATGGGALAVGALSNSKLNDGEAGWLVCDGSLVDGTGYPDLLALKTKLGNVGYDFTRSAVAGLPSISNTPFHLAFNVDGTLLVVGHSGTGRYVLIQTSDWTAVTGTPSLSAVVWGCEFSPDGKYLALAHTGGSDATVIDLDTLNTVAITSPPSWGREVAFSPDSSLMAVGHDTGITIYDTSDWSIVTGTPAVTGACYGLVFSPDGTQLAAGTTSTQALYVFNTSDWSAVAGVPAINGFAYSLDYSSDGGTLAIAAGSSPFVTVLDTTGWSEVFTSSAIINDANGVAFSTDGAHLAVAHASGTLTIFETTGWTAVDVTTQLATLSGNGRSCDFSPSDEYLAVATDVAPFFAVFPAKDYGPDGFFYLPTLAPVTYGNVTAKTLIKAE